ncbi:MAG TPA: carboxyl transferase domain-containing protein [Thermodesulfobacteriota bacterium]|nr:carboxyl transferase domain-containing protein [Thermodesulfobacteriota bacterium]
MKEEDILELFKRRTRNPFRPRSSQIIQHLFTHFKPFSPVGESLICGEAKFKEKRVLVIGQEKPTLEKMRNPGNAAKLNMGMLSADEHSQILGILQQARTMDPEELIIFCLIDTYGADISMTSARRFQAYFISHLIYEFLTIPIRTASVVIGEGGSGGALALQVTDRRGQMEDALYATAPPESMASIIFRDSSKIREALLISKPTARDLKRLGVIDQVLPVPKEIQDIVGFADSVGAYLEKSIHDLSHIKIKKLLDQREKRALAYGLPRQQGKLHELTRMIEKPFKRFFYKFPPEFQIVTYDGKTEIPDDYAVQEPLETNQDYIRCGQERSPKSSGGCGRLIKLEDYLKNCQVCPFCGRQNILDAGGWINCLADEDSFFELNRNLTADSLLDEQMITNYYRQFLDKQKSHFNESLVTGEAEIFGHPVVLAISEFYFSGGSMGVVFGEKFKQAADLAIEKKVPLISLCCSGGARLYEGILALMQMVKTIASINRLKRHGLPFISILGDPSTGGAIASFASLGDVILAEPKALVIFTGPRVMESRGFEVDEALIRSDSLQQLSGLIYQHQDYFFGIRGIHEVTERKDLKRTLAKYLEFYLKSLPRPS